MTKKELLKQIEDLANSNGANVSGKQTEKLFNAVIECVRKSTIAEGKLAIADLGSFTVKTRAARKGHNPKTGEAMNIPETKSVSFKPAKSFKDLAK